MSESLTKASINPLVLAEFAGAAAPARPPRGRSPRPRPNIVSSRGWDDGYKAAASTRLRERHMRTGSGDRWFTKMSRQRQRDYSRDLYRNDLNYHRIVDAMVQQIVGGGWRPMPLTEDPEWNNAAEEAWTRFVETGIDVSGRYGYLQHLQMVVREAILAGDVGILFTTIGRVQLLENELIGSPSGEGEDGADREKGERVIDGVKIDAWGRRIAYYVGAYDEHGSARFGKDQGRWIASGAMELLGAPERPSQQRGAPALSHCMDRIQDLSEFIEFTLVAARVAACFAAVIESENPEDTSDDFDVADTGSGSYSPTGLDRYVQGVQRAQREQLMTPGQVLYVGRGDKVQTVQPNQPAPIFDVFTKAVQRELAACGAGLPTELVYLDFKASNFSNSKAAFALARQAFEPWREWLQARYLTRLYRWKVAEWVRRGVLDWREDMYRVDWLGSEITWIDPAKEVSATAEAIQKNMLTYREFYARQGKDYRREFEKRAEEGRLMEALGLETVVDPGSATIGGQPEREDGSDPGDREA